MTNSPADLVAAAPPRGPGRWAPLWVIAFVALWPAPGIAETVLALGALLTVARLLQLRWQGGIAPLLSVPAWALTTVLFLAYWLPQLFSAVDAIDADTAWIKVAAGLRYLPFMWLVAIAVATGPRRRLTFAGLAVIAGVWVVDALLQAVTGTSALFWSLDQLKWLINGHALCTLEEVAAVDRLSGVFGPCNLKFGQVLASLSPFLLFGLARRWGMPGWLVGAVATGVVMLLAGSRAAWITYALVLLFSGWRLLGSRRLLLVMALGVAGAIALALGSAQVRERLARTTLAFSGDAAGVDAALSGRSQIWSAALCMVREHPINGVGARGFRDAYPGCDPNPARTAAWGEGPALHAHQIVLEILAETGVLGLLLWLAGAAMAWRAWRYAPADARVRARPAALALAVTVFPFNTHLAFYSAFWGGLTLMLAALYAGSLLARGDER
ncbi:MAG: O-antigen ligase family protein [Stenotrophomonas sp.]